MEEIHKLGARGFVDGTLAVAGAGRACLAHSVSSIRLAQQPQAAPRVTHFCTSSPHHPFDPVWGASQSRGLRSGQVRSASSRSHSKLSMAYHENSSQRRVFTASLGRERNSLCQSPFESSHRNRKTQSKPQVLLDIKNQLSFFSAENTATALGNVPSQVFFPPKQNGLLYSLHLPDAIITRHNYPPHII